jgi:soluble lytic murein transglycosylase-like protein
LLLVGALFIPLIAAIQHLPKPDVVEEDTESVSVPAPEPPRSKELIKVHAILKTHRPDLSEPEAWWLSDVILGESAGYGFDPLLVLAVIDIESKFQYRAVSPAGARGIMQILPYVAKSLVEKVELHQPSYKSFRPEFLDDPALNIKLGVYYLHDLKKHFRNLTHTLIAYNMGPTETKNRLENDIELSENYATLVLAAYQQYKNGNIKRPTF